MKRMMLVVVIALGLAVVAGQTGLVAQDGSGTALGERSNAASSPQHPGHGVVHGAYIPPINNYGTEVKAFAECAGKDLGIVMYFPGWDMAPSEYWWLPFKLGEEYPEEHRPYLMLAWTPLGRDCRKTPPEGHGDLNLVTSLYDIADGHCDDYIELVARELKVLDFTFMMRFAQEMNNYAIPWWVGHYNKDPQLYIDAYRRIHDIFTKEGVTNVQWVWSPNYASMPREEWNSLFNYYPGDEYVDWVGLSVYNWGGELPDAYANADLPWWSLTDMLDSDTWDHILPALSCRYAKPIVLEIGSVDGSRPGDGTKDRWVQQAYEQLDQFPFIKAVVWFNDHDYHLLDGADFRVVGGSSWDPDPWHKGYAYPLPENDGRWTRGYSAAVARDRFISYVPPLADITPPATYCGGQPAIDVPSSIAIVPGETITFRMSVVGLTQDAKVFIKGLSSDVTVQCSKTSLLAPWDEMEVTITVNADADFYSLPLTLVIDTGTTVYETLFRLSGTGEPIRTFLPFTIKPE